MVADENCKICEGTGRTRLICNDYSKDNNNLFNIKHIKCLCIEVAKKDLCINSLAMLIKQMSEVTGLLSAKQLHKNSIKLIESLK